MKKQKKIVLCALLMMIFTAGCAMEAKEVIEFNSIAPDRISINGLSGGGVSDSSISDSSIPEAAVSENSISDNSISENSVSDNTISESVKVKGIYVTGPMAGHAKMQELIQLVEDTELNAMVIDIKNDEGRITYRMESDRVVEMEAPVAYIQDIDQLMRQLKEKNIYTIARIVAFRDPYLAEKKPELSLKTKTGQIFYDKSGLAWVNPYEQEVWEYLMEVAIQAAQAGFDEIQFDYVRFSTDSKISSVDYGEKAEEKSKEQIITEFVQYAYQTLHPYGVKVSADVFGTVIDNKVDTKIIGQNYKEIANNLDVICPMVYPSHYGSGVYGIQIPDANPYRTILKAMSSSREVLGDTNVKVRPWLQDFTAGWIPGHIAYGPKQIREQIQAVYDAGYEEWILWNASNRYTKGGLLP